MHRALTAWTGTLKHARVIHAVYAHDIHDSDSTMNAPVLVAQCSHQSRISGVAHGHQARDSTDVFDFASAKALNITTSSSSCLNTTSCFLTSEMRASSSSSSKRPMAHDKRASGTKRARTTDKENEDAFMADLLAGLDGKEFDAPPSSSLPSPIKAPTPRRATVPSSMPENDLVDFLSQPKMPTPRRPLAPLARSPVRRPAAPSAFRPLKRAEVKPKVEQSFEVPPVKEVKVERVPPSVVKAEPVPQPIVAEAEPEVKPAFDADAEDDFPLPSASQESHYDMDWDLDALAMLDEKSLVKETVSLMGGDN